MERRSSALGAQWLQTYTGVRACMGRVERLWMPGKGLGNYTDLRSASSSANSFGTERSLPLEKVCGLTRAETAAAATKASFQHRLCCCCAAPLVGSCAASSKSPSASDPRAGSAAGRTQQSAMLLRGRNCRNRIRPMQDIPPCWHGIRRSASSLNASRAEPNVTRLCHWPHLFS